MASVWFGVIFTLVCFLNDYLLKNFQVALTHSNLKQNSIVIPLNQMSRSGEKHAQDYNLMWCILMALRVIYFWAVIYGEPVYFEYQCQNLRTLLLVRGKCDNYDTSICEWARCPNRCPIHQYSTVQYSTVQTITIRQSVSEQGVQIDAPYISLHSVLYCTVLYCDNYDLSICECEGVQIDVPYISLHSAPPLTRGTRHRAKPVKCRQGGNKNTSLFDSVKKNIIIIV